MSITLASGGGDASVEADARKLLSAVCSLHAPCEMPDPKVLVVEDDSAIRSLIVAALRREPLEVHTAADGLAALDCVRSNDYAVILLDLMMPRLNGYEFLESMEGVRPDAHPVVIVMTAFDATALRTMRANCVHAVLHKPFDVERVVGLVRDCVSSPRLSVRDEPRDEPETGVQPGALPPPPHLSVRDQPEPETGVQNGALPPPPHPEEESSVC